MSAADYLVLALIAGALALGFWLGKKQKQKGGCCGDCTGCSGCGQKEESSWNR